MTRPTDRTGKYGGVLRLGMILLIVPQAVAGLWAFIAPRSFYDSFPGFGRVWVAPVGPYNEHFIADTGNLLLVLCVLLGVAALYLERRLVRVALVCWLVFSIPHLISHIRLTSLFDAADNAGNIGSLSLGVLLPIVLLVLTWRDEPLVGER